MGTDLRRTPQMWKNHESLWTEVEDESDYTQLDKKDIQRRNLNSKYLSLTLVLIVCIAVNKQRKGNNRPRGFNIEPKN